MAWCGLEPFKLNSDSTVRSVATALEKSRVRLQALSKIRNLRTSLFGNSLFCKVAQSATIKRCSLIVPSPGLQIAPSAHPVTT